MTLYSFDDLLDRCGIAHVDVLKLHIEGAEFELLDGATKLPHVTEIVVEVHRDHPDRPEDVERWLEGVAARAGLSVRQLRRDIFSMHR